MAQNITVPPQDLGYALVASERAITTFDKDAFIGKPSIRPVLGCGTQGKVDGKTLAVHLLSRIMPGFVAIESLAAKHSPPAEYFDGEMERPW